MIKFDVGNDFDADVEDDFDLPKSVTSANTAIGSSLMEDVDNEFASGVEDPLVRVNANTGNQVVDVIINATDMANSGSSLPANDFDNYWKALNRRGAVRSALDSYNPVTGAVEFGASLAYNVAVGGVATLGAGVVAAGDAALNAPRLAGLPGLTSGDNAEKFFNHTLTYIDVPENELAKWATNAVALPFQTLQSIANVAADTFNAAGQYVAQSDADRQVVAGIAGLLKASPDLALTALPLAFRKSAGRLLDEQQNTNPTKKPDDPMQLQKGQIVPGIFSYDELSQLEGWKKPDTKNSTALDNTADVGDDFVDPALAAMLGDDPGNINRFDPDSPSVTVGDTGNTRTQPSAQQLQELVDALNGVGDPPRVVVSMKKGQPVSVAVDDFVVEGFNALRDLGKTMKKVPVFVKNLDDPWDNTPQAQAAANKWEIGWTDKINRAAAEEKVGKTSYILEKAQEWIFDPQGHAKNVLRRSEATGNTIASKALRAMELEAGATQFASARFDAMRKTIWGGLENMFDRTARTKEGNPLLQADNTRMTKIQLLDRFIKQRRTITQAQSEGLTTTEAYKEAQYWLTNMHDKLGTRVFDDYQIRAEMFERGMLESLDRLHNAGIIADDAYEIARSRKYYMQPEFIERIDPTFGEARKKNAKLSDPTKGDTSDLTGELPHLLDRDLELIDLDSQSLMVENFIRTEAAIARNGIWQKLADVSQTPAKVPGGVSPMFGIARLPRDASEKIPNGFKQVNYFLDGEKQKLFLQEDFYKSFTSTDVQTMADAMSWVSFLSGTTPLKALAVGLNPAFAPVSFMMDVTLSYLNTANQYSRNPVKYVGQIGADMREVAGDVLNGTGLYKEAVEIGGIPDFRSSQGLTPMVFSRNRSSKKTVSPGFISVKNALTFPQRFSENLVRTAIMNRVLKNQKSAGLPRDIENAASIARRMVDFHPKGFATRIADTQIPFLHAATRGLAAGFSGVSNADKFKAKTLPGGEVAPLWKPDAPVIEKFLSSMSDSDAAQWAQRVSVAMGSLIAMDTVMWSLFGQNSDGSEGIMADIDDITKRRYVIVPTPFKTVDDNGQELGLYAKFRGDPFIMALAAPARAAVQRFFTGKETTDNTLDWANELFPVKDIPTTSAAFQAIRAFMDNTHPHFHNKIWHGRENVPAQEMYTADTRPIAVALGQAVGLPPAQLSVAMDSILPRSNLFIGAMDLGAQFMVEQDRAGPEFNTFRDKTYAEVVNKIPVLNTVLAAANPAANKFRQLSTSAEQPSGRLTVYDRKMEEILSAQNRGERIESQFNELLQQMKTQGDVLQISRAEERYKLGTKLQQVKGVIGDSFIDYGFQWWRSVYNAEPAIRARIFYDAWKDAPTPEARKRLMSGARVLSSGGLSFMSPEFYYRFEQLKKKHGQGYVMSVRDYAEGLYETSVASEE